LVVKSRCRSGCPWIDHQSLSIPRYSYFTNLAAKPVRSSMSRSSWVLEQRSRVPIYPLIDNYMPQPHLMKLNKININENYLSSDVIFIALTHFLNYPHSGLKYAIQFCLINIPQHLLQGLTKLILVSHLNPFEFSFIARNMQKSLRARSGE
jgi:hypothetical protein